MSIQSRLVKHSIFRSKTIPEFEEAPEVEDGKVMTYSLGQKIRFPMVNILDDVVLKKTKKNEFDNQKFFSDKVLEQVSQHFPLVYRYEEKDDNILMMMEKFDGDCDDDIDDIDEFFSFLLQIIMALYTIDSNGKFHGDLNPGNLLYKKIDDDKSDHKGYLKYVIEGQTYYIKHYNKLWVVSDFEYTGNKGEVLDSRKGFDTSFFKRLFREHYDSIKEPVKGSWLYDMYVITHFSKAYKMAERVFNLMNDGCSLNPIETIPLIIKNEIQHIFIREIDLFNKE
jgi:serine/threonine protein kinase